jgi:hypothetical protein
MEEKAPVAHPMLVIAKDRHFPFSRFSVHFMPEFCRGWSPVRLESGATHVQ